MIFKRFFVLIYFLISNISSNISQIYIEYILNLMFVQLTVCESPAKKLYHKRPSYTNRSINMLASYGNPV